MKPVRIRRAAREDFREAADWYGSRDPQLAERFEKAVLSQLKLLGHFPELFAIDVAVPDVRRALVPDFPYRIFYRDRPATVDVMAILNARRRPGEIARRLRREPQNPSDD